MKLSSRQKARLGALLLAQSAPAECVAEGVLLFDIGGLLIGFALYILGFFAIIVMASAFANESKFALPSALAVYLLAPLLYICWSVYDKNAQEEQIREQQQRNAIQTRETLERFCREYQGNAVPACRKEK